MVVTWLFLELNASLLYGVLKRQASSSPLDHVPQEFDVFILDSEEEGPLRKYDNLVILAIVPLAPLLARQIGCETIVKLKSLTIVVFNDVP